MVSGPFVEFYSKQSKVGCQNSLVICYSYMNVEDHCLKVHVTVATESREDGQRLSRSGNVTPFVIDVRNEHDVLDQLIRDHDQVVSLLPYVFHPLVAKLCIKNRKSMLTSSYVSPELEALDEAAKNAGITIMNECGLDPGIDHMLAMECIDEVREHGGKVVSFVSFCGGLPAPEYSDNPLRYKFSWSPKGVLNALLNPARYLLEGKVVEVPKGKVVDHLYPIDFMPGFNLIGYANRDSVKYADIYGIGSECRTLIRGTLRYKGFVETVKALDAIGLLSTQQQEIFNPVVGPDLTWKQLMAFLLNQKLDIFPDSLRNLAADRIGAGNQIGVRALSDLGLFSDIVADRHGCALDTLAAYLSKILAFSERERDIVILNHDIGVRLQNGNAERHRISLVAYGEVKGFSAMSRTVGYTCAIVSNMMLQGEIQRSGILRPVSKEIYRPCLKRLSDYDIVAVKSINLAS
ncbi:saccharopine dehydrogenase [Dictyocaulus viviparus]|uniref:Saccharopine dehydrogenase n=1 Tax=Dictyocaulus viviparus TaxID=29172 RepID=A0A0D8X970_DICVI|nr:saccharopine dehydrogenase [Dictyocaulus viviparus]